MVSEKYLAGFLDADGSIELICPSANTKWFHPYVKLSWSQKESRSRVLEEIAVDYGLRGRTKTVDGCEYMEVYTSGEHANMLLSRIAKFLVIKRAYADTVMAFVRTKVKTVDEAQRGKKVVVAVRKSKSQSEPNYPSRQWLAGYFDGDGCIYADVKYGRSASIRAVICCAEYDVVGLRLLKKAFGGSISPKNESEKVMVWELYLDAAKAKQFLGFFAKHSIVKRSQMYFVLGCAANNNFRDGDTIAKTLKTLKAHPHRLSDSAVDVSSLVAEVKIVPSLWAPKMGLSACRECGTTEVRCAGQGLCENCYARNRRRQKR